MKCRYNSFSHRALFILIAITFSFTCFAQQPDFSGTWKLNASKSKMGTEFSMAPVTLIITQEDNTLASESISNFQGQEFRQNNTYRLDGSESKNEFQGMELVSIVNWKDDGQSVEIKTTIQMMDMGELTITQSYSMDGENLVVDNTMDGGPMGGGSPERWVYDKQ